LIDIVNFTGQATRLAEKTHRPILPILPEKIDCYRHKHEFRVIKFLGDAALIFALEPGKLLDIMLDLYSGQTRR